MYLAHTFHTVAGYLATKTETLRSLKVSNREGYLLFMGDALADYEAARAAGVRFIGVDAKSKGHFVPLNVPIIQGFTDLQQLHRLIGQA